MNRRATWMLGTALLAVLAAGVGLRQTLRQPRWFVLVGRSGEIERLGEAPRSAFAPRVSPDGSRIVYDQSGGTLWVAPLRGITLPRRLPALPDAQFPVWDGDAGRVFYASTPDDAYALFFTRVDGSGVPRVALRPEARAPESWSNAHDGLTFITLAGDDYDVWFYGMSDRRVIAVAAQKGTAQSASHFSPDGRWIAYESNETGRFEVYVTAFPPSGPRVRVTRGGGRRPVWASERELSFDDGN